MEQGLILAAGIIGASLVVATIIHTAGRVRVEQQRLLRSLLERGGTPNDVITALRSNGAASADRRRGFLLLAAGLSWSLCTYFVGGIAWIFGAIPSALGLVYVAFGARNAGER